MVDHLGLAEHPQQRPGEQTLSAAHLQDPRWTAALAGHVRAHGLAQQQDVAMLAAILGGALLAVLDEARAPGRVEHATIASVRPVSGLQVALGAVEDEGDDAPRTGDGSR